VSATGYSYTEDESDDEEDIVLEVRDAGVIYDMERGQSQVLNDVSIDIRRKEILGVVGESGSGKSMFAEALLNHVEDDGVLTGEILYHPEDGETLDVVDQNTRETKSLRWEEISMVFQGAMTSFNPTMRIREHFTETIYAHNAKKDERMEFAEELLQQLYLDPERVLDSYPHELSGGMKQRALIALALVLEPEVLVMDEPTAALDLLMQRSIISLLSQLSEKYEITVVFITHDLPLVAGLVDRLSVLYAGEFIELGDGTDVIEHAAHPYTRALLRSAPSLGSPVEEMEPIPGGSPDPVNLPSGCSYHSRCPLADDRCEIEDPDRASVGDDHGAACFYWEQSADEIPYTLHSGTPGGAQ